MSPATMEWEYTPISETYIKTREFHDNENISEDQQSPKVNSA